MTIDTKSMTQHVMFWLLVAFIAGFGFSIVLTKADINPFHADASPPGPGGGYGCGSGNPNSPTYCGPIGGGPTGGGGTGHTGSPASFEGDIDVPPGTPGH